MRTHTELGLLFSILGLVLPGCKAPEEKASAPLAGCASDRPAVAHYAGGEAANPQPANAPLPCSIDTGFDTYDPSVVVTPEGMLVTGPATNEAVARSTNNGQTWEGPISVESVPDSHNGFVHPWLWRDKTSGRLFYSGFDPGGPAEGCSQGGSYLWLSDDDGTSWERHGVGCGSQDYGKTITGPAVTDASKAALARNGYPNVVYFCATGPAFIIGPNRMCYRSLDGGTTFTRTKKDAIDPANGQAGWPNSGWVGPDGSIYFAHVSSNGVAISTSRDEGDSWVDVYIPDSSLSANPRNWLSSNVTTDAEGNVYVAWVDDRDYLPRVAWSRDRGNSWSKPVLFGAPDIKTATYPNLVAREPGFVAIVYYGSQQAEGSGGDGYFSDDGRPYHAYMAVTRNLFAAKPLFWSAILNDPSTPVTPGMRVTFSEYLGVPAFGPDGSVWASYLKAAKNVIGRLTPSPRNK